MLLLATLSIAGFCVSGQELIGDTCVKCKKDHYKNNDDDTGPFSPCVLCPPDVNGPRRTNEEGADDGDKCTIGKFRVTRY